MSLQTLPKDIYTPKLTNNCDLATDSPPYRHLTEKIGQNSKRADKNWGKELLKYNVKMGINLPEFYTDVRGSQPFHIRVLLPTAHTPCIFRGIFTQMTVREVTAAIFKPKQDKLQEITAIRGLQSGNRVYKLSRFQAMCGIP